MQYFLKLLKYGVLSTVWFLLLPIPAWAHEYVSFSASNFFVNLVADLALTVPLIYLYVYIRKTAGKEPGWRYIYLAMLFFTIWSLQHLTEDVLGQLMAPSEYYFHNNTFVLRDRRSILYCIFKLTRPWVGLGGVLFLYFGLRNLRLTEEEKKRV